MKNEKIVFSSFLISVFWILLKIFFSVIILVLRKVDLTILIKNIFFAIPQHLPLFGGIFVANYFFLKKQKKVPAFLAGFLANIFLLFLIIFIFPQFCFFATDSIDPKFFARIVAPQIFWQNLILLFLQQIFLCGQNLENLEKIILRIGIILFFYNFLFYLWIFFNSIIIFFATKTGSTAICNFNSDFFPPAIQKENCWTEMAKKGFSACEKMENDFAKNSCFLKKSLYLKNKKICEKISNIWSDLYIECIFGEKTNFAKNCVAEKNHRGMQQNYSSKIDGDKIILTKNDRKKNENFSFKNCVKKKFAEFQKIKKSEK